MLVIEPRAQAQHQEISECRDITFTSGAIIPVLLSRYLPPAVVWGRSRQPSRMSRSKARWPWPTSHDPMCTLTAPSPLILQRNRKQLISHCARSFCHRAFDSRDIDKIRQAEMGPHGLHDYNHRLHLCVDRSQRERWHRYAIPRPLLRILYLPYYLYPVTPRPRPAHEARSILHRFL